MTDAHPRIHAIYRYPIKGLSPESLACTRLAVEETLPADRLYAIENGPSGFDPGAPRHQPKQRYLLFMRNQGLAPLRPLIADAKPPPHDRSGRTRSGAGRSAHARRSFGDRRVLRGLLRR